MACGGGGGGGGGGGARDGTPGQACGVGKCQGWLTRTVVAVCIGWGGGGGGGQRLGDITNLHDRGGGGGGRGDRM